ncbi:MAG: RidA family protein [Pseudomonadota bacterium]
MADADIGLAHESPEQRLGRLGIALPPRPHAPIGNFANVRTSRGMLYISGQGPVTPDGTYLTGKVGADVSTDDARDHARLVGLNLLSVAREAAGSLDRIAGVVKLLGMVNAVPDYRDHPRVINGCSDLLIEIFGPDGVHARSAIGVGSLPNQITVEIEAIFELAG